MTKLCSPENAGLPEDNEYVQQEVKANAIGVPNEQLSFPGAQYFNKIMHEKIEMTKRAAADQGRK